MFERARDFCYTLLYKLRVWSTYALGLSLVLATSYYVLDPGGKPHIAVSGNPIVVEFPLFRECEITFLRPLDVRAYAIQKSDDVPAGGGRGSARGDSTTLDRKVFALHIGNPYFQASPASNAASSYRIVIYTRNNVSCQISSVVVDGRPLDLETIVRDNLRVRGEFVRFRYMRKDLANVIFGFNDVISNWVLTFMGFGIAVLALQLAATEVRVHLMSDRAFDRYLTRSFKYDAAVDGDARRDAFARCAAHWDILDRRFEFFQALGPAIGFIFTVSSLVEALHPALRASRDAYAFLSGIHVALISTFRGLLMRLVALESARVNDRLFERARTRICPADSV